MHEHGLPVVCIEVGNSGQIVSTSKGRTLQRRLKADGTPEVVPLFVSQFISRLSQQRSYDYSDQPAPESVLSDLDPQARNRLRAHIRQTNAGNSLLAFDDEDFDKALDLVVDGPEGPCPSVAGLLTIGTVDAIRRSLPTATAMFQVMSGTVPRVNVDPFALPLVDMFDRIDALLEPWNPSHEVMSGLVRTEIPDFDRQAFREAMVNALPLVDMFDRIDALLEPWNPSHEVMSGLVRTEIPDFDRQAFREAMVNAFCHRDYAAMGSVRFLVDDDGLTVANPGGFIEGMNEETLLTAQPHSRNPQLALVLKTAGYAERTGRGVDVIYAGALASGGPLPDYSQSDGSQVVLFLRRAVPDEAFVSMVAEEERRRGAPLSVWALIVLSLYSQSDGSQVVLFLRRAVPDEAFVSMVAEEERRRGAPLSVWALIVLSLLKEHRRLTLAQMCGFSHLQERRVVRTVEELVESGLVEATGNGSVRSYVLGERVYRRADAMVSYARQRDVDTVRRNDMVLDFARRNGGAVSTSEVMELLNLTYISAYRLLKGLEESGKVRHEGSGPSSGGIRSGGGDRQWLGA